jgi:hypothetical protein
MVKYTAIDEVVDAVLQVHGACGHGEHVFGTIIGDQVYAWCNRCRMQSVSVEFMAARTRELHQEEE